MSLLLYLVPIAWIAMTALLFRFADSKRAVIVGVFGGFLALPWVTLELTDWLVADRGVAIGVGLWLGILLFDRRILRGVRLDWIDAPVMLLPLIPLFSVLSNGGGTWQQAWVLSWKDLWGITAVWAAGRLYFAKAADLRRILVATAVAALVYVPVCIYEMIVGPDFYVAHLVYDLAPREGQVERLGGWRPTGMMTSGLELCAFLAVATVAAAGCWRTGPAARIWRLPPWLPPLILFATTLACRGVYGYSILALGTIALIVMVFTSDRVVLAVLMIAAASYMVLRIGGMADETLLSLADAIHPERAGTVGYRLEAEAQHINAVREHNPALGFGGAELEGLKFADGWWIRRFRDTGLIGLAVWYVALLVMPVGVTIHRLLRASQYPTPAIPAAVLALLICLVMIDGLHNTTLLPIALFGGCLVSLAASKRQTDAAP